MLLTGFAGLISLGTAGLLAAGAYSVGVLVREIGAPFWVTLPAAAVLGAFLGLIFGLPSLAAARPLSRHQHARAAFRRRLSRRRIRGARGAVDRRHDRFAVDRQLVAEQRAWHGISCCWVSRRSRCLISVNLQRTRTGRAWRALRERDVVAGALGIDVQRFKLLAFVVSATMTAIAGALFAYFRNFVSIDAFSLYLTVQYVAMIIIGGMGSIPGALLGAGFVILFPYAIEAIAALPARPLRQHGVRARLRGVRRRHDPVPAARAGRPDRHLAPA